MRSLSYATAAHQQQQLVPSTWSWTYDNLVQVSRELLSPCYPHVIYHPPLPFGYRHAQSSGSVSCALFVFFFFFLHRFSENESSRWRLPAIGAPVVAPPVDRAPGRRPFHWVVGRSQTWVYNTVIVRTEKLTRKIGCDSLWRLTFVCFFFFFERGMRFNLKKLKKISAYNTILLMLLSIQVKEILGYKHFDFNSLFKIEL